ncbi:hypothetical protein Bbelb_252990 [Branchiostoma belcheri]|nr:hypothetical protein Bbelb_252990 [Branchiostoma belcheri]
MEVKTSPDGPPTDQPQTDNQARADDDENSPDVTYANIPDDSPMDQPQTDNQARANGDKNTAEATHANIPAVDHKSSPRPSIRRQVGNVLWPQVTLGVPQQIPDIAQVVESLAPWAPFAVRRYIQGICPAWFPYRHSKCMSQESKLTLPYHGDKGSSDSQPYSSIVTQVVLKSLSLVDLEIDGLLQIFSSFQKAVHANSSGPQSDDRHEANNPGSAETTGDMPGVNRKSKVRPSAMLKTLFSVINIVLRCCLLCAVIYLVTVSESQQNQLTAEYLRQWKQSVITIDKTATTLANVSDWMDRMHGCAMGSPVSPIVVNLYMEKFENKALSTFNDTPPANWFRYVDDTWCRLKKRVAADFFDHINQIDDNIKFTQEPSHDNMLPFLDTKTIVEEDGNLRFEVYRKPTHTDQYLAFDSHHPLEHKLAVIKTLFHRADNIVTSDQAKTDEQKHLRGVSEKLRRIFQNFNIAPNFKPHSTLRQRLVHPKDRPHKGTKANVIYRLKCEEPNCNNTYIGETSRPLKVRYKEHCRPSANGYSSAIFHHLQHNQGHSFKLESTDILDRETRWWERGVKEAIYERMYNPTLNREGGLRVDLSGTWDLALPAPRTDNT